MFHKFIFKKANAKKWKYYPRKFFTSLCLAIKKQEKKEIHTYVLSFDTFPPLLQHMFLIKSSHCKFCAWLTYINFSLANYIVGTPSCCGCALSIAHYCTGRFYPTLFCNLKFLVPGATIINRLEVKA